MAPVPAKCTAVVGGCKDGMVLDDNPSSLVEDKGYRYYLLAKNARVDTRFRDVPSHEYGKPLQALLEHGHPVNRRFRDVRRLEFGKLLREFAKHGSQVSDLSRADVEQITRQLQHVTVHVYEVAKITETPDTIEVTLSFVEEVLGL